ncbi:MAG: flippase-like domain-containing protein [Candidatus Marinimicrobia bacterium]|nr:flippase-like domain-containing protein [Candidatus Neomarinimicrobiota bacterium]MBT3691588.1 flippase-like domain-containing protein [Candidatus Neomarinimicrobiota bacterium]MBT3731459.1 flippase-like domain-containing protein [Candidatus Neomarinimicrobiota bacterium]MBT4144161.1 flippase-like domain-containing protein [Candidatus Neomarinimicrobiota bacterium]MBT4178526.1 flippase-like domain-containing protein [Candidatus Neomarinimicrobiota bacterium]
MNKFIKIIISVFISGFGLYFAFKGEQFDVLWVQILEVQILPLSISIFLLIFSIYVRAKRWQVILLPVEKIDSHTLFASTMVGYFGNGVLFFRLGELLRGYSIASKSKLSVSQAFGTILLERALDMMSVVILIIVVSPFYPYSNPIFRTAIFTISIISISAGVFLYLSQKYYWIDKFRHFSIVKVGIGKVAFQVFEKIFDGITLLRQTRHSFIILLYSIFLWIIYYSVTLLLLSSVYIDIGWIGPAVILIAGSIGLAIPALPGAAGTYDSVIKFALIALFTISSEQALAYALISHSASFFPFVIIGMIYFIFGSVRIKDIKKGSAGEI